MISLQQPAAVSSLATSTDFLTASDKTFKLMQTLFLLLSVPQLWSQNTKQSSTHC
jgi:hypothetical protein